MMTHITRTNFQSHPFHLVSLSSCSLFTCFTLLTVTTILVLYMHGFFGFIQLTKGKKISIYPWLTPQFYSDILRALLDRAYDSLEWGLNSPPRPHSFVSLPLQSMPELPTEILNMIGAYIQINTYADTRVLVAHISDVYSGIDHLYNIWDMDYTTPRLIALDPTISDIAQTDLTSNETSQTLDQIKGNIHEIANYEKNSMVLDPKGELFNKPYAYTVEEGIHTSSLPNSLGITETISETTTHTSTAEDMIRDHKSAWNKINRVLAAKHKRDMFRELPYSDPDAIVRQENMEMFKELPFSDHDA